jgi:tRNA pseudouridine38-40 synthase
MSKRYKLTIEYDGTNYCGFQKQKELGIKTIEGVLGKAILGLTHEEVKIIACGRTDAGVHALGQVVHFELNKEFDLRKMITGINHYLKDEDVAALNCEMVSDDFHARLSAKKRYYRYIITNRSGKLTLDKNRTYHVALNLDEKLMQKASSFLIGKHDFSSFRDAECQSRTPIRSIDSIKITRDGERISIEVEAKSFLHHMVRNIVGTLVLAGRKKMIPGEMKNILEKRDRTESGPNAPSCGLYFVRCEY